MGASNGKVSSGNAGMEKLIPIVNKLQDVCTQMGTTLQFDLPQIAVIGSQSAGKSSVLENFVGQDFLPRGNNIVTRRPLILQLINGKEEYGEFNHCMDDSNNCKKFHNFADIRAEIEAETDRETGNNKGISNKPIRLRIYSPNVLDLTLVDLPGITKVPVGDQPADIEEQIREMILGFIRKENCLILAVSPANCDLANSDALKLAKEVDEDGFRTIGVITKLDLMDEGTHARDIFDGKLLPLRRGYIGVVNRSQRDIENQKDIEATLQAERDFFNNHNYYQHIAGRLGTPYLQKVLNQQLKEHIRETMHNLQDKTHKQMDALEREMIKYEDLHPEEPSSMREVMLKIIFQLRSDFEKEMGCLGSDDVFTDRLSCGAQIRRIFHERFPNDISKVQFDEDKLRKEIVIAIENLYGINGVLNTPFKAFEALVKKQVLRLEEPIKMCIDLVVKELSNAVRNCTKNISGYPNFRDYVENEIISFVQKKTLSDQRNILSLVQMQSAYMNSMHYEFKNDKQIGLAAQLLEQIAATYDGLTFDQRRELASELAQRAAGYTNTGNNVQKTDNGIIREGNLYIGDKKSESGPYWFILRSNTLSCCDPDDHNEHTAIPLYGLKFRLKKEVASSKQKIILFKPGGENVHQNHKELKLSSTSIGDIRSWTKCFSLVIESDNKNVLDSFEKDIDDTYEKITSYMQIVKKTMCDMVPKAITLFIIRKLQTFIEMELLIRLTGVLNDGDLNMFGADEEEAEKYKKTKKMYETCEKALEIMSEC